MKKIKAYLVESAFDPAFSTVVFADSRGKAKAAAQYTDVCEDLEFTEIRAVRKPALDKYYRGQREMDWYNAEDRIALVKDGNFSCSYEIPNYDLHCEICPAKKWCDRYQEVFGFLDEEANEEIRR